MYGSDQVVIIARKAGANGGEHVTTYGRDRSHCEVAARIGDFLKFKVMDRTREGADRCICCGSGLREKWHGPGCEESTAVADDVRDFGTGYAQHTAEIYLERGPQALTDDDFHAVSAPFSVRQLLGTVSNQI